MSFVDFVAIKLPKTSPSTIDYKSMASFVASVGQRPDLSDEDRLRLWVATMIEKGLSPLSRKRYVEKLHSIFKEYLEVSNEPEDGLETVESLGPGSLASLESSESLVTAESSRSTGESTLSPVPYESAARLLSSQLSPYPSWESLVPLRDYVAPFDPAEMRGHAATLARVIDTMVTDAKTRPFVGLFLYLLFNADSDLERAVSLKVADYRPSLPQLDEIIDTEKFHHRRVYLFNLNQSRKRLPQLLREVTGEIADYLAYRGIRLSHPFDPLSIVALWIGVARETGVAMDDIREVVDSSEGATPTDIPAEYGYLRHLNGSGLTPVGADMIRRRVAERLSPSGRRWYAMKLRRGVTFEQMRDSLHQLIGGEYPSLCDDSTFFYPRSESKRRVGRRIVTDMVPVIPDVVFFMVRPRHVRIIDEAVRTEGLGWVFRVVNTPGSEYSVIDRASMLNFQLVIGVFTPDVKIGLTRETPIGIGRRVRITGGIMAGYTGIIYDIKDTPEGTPDGARQIYIRLSTDYAVKVEIHVDEFYVQPA